MKVACLFCGGQPLYSWETRPAIRIAFLGYPSGVGTLLLAGIPLLELSTAHEGVSVFETFNHRNIYSIPDLAKLIESFQKDIATPVGQYCSLPRGKEPYPFSHHPTIINRNGDQIACYGTAYINGHSVPAYVVLPQLKSNALSLVKLLEELTRLRPELFPDREVRDWYGGKAFAFKEELEIDREIEARIEEVKQFLAEKEQLKARVVAHFEFMKKILVAREDPGLPAEDRLSVNVRKTLEFLGFKVEDIDAKIKGVIRKEDFWVLDDKGFLAITEVTGTNAKNPKSKEYNDLLGRMSTIFKRRDLVPDPENISGLLIVTNPTQRPKLYGGEAEEIVDAAKDQNIGLLSTQELHKIAIAAKDGVITNEQARALIKGFGRIEFVVVDRPGETKPK